MTISDPSRPRSRPRALCLDLSGTEKLTVPSPNPNGLVLDQDTPATFAGHLLQLAVDTGLPMVILPSGNLGDEELDLIASHSGQMMVPKLPQRVIRSGHMEEKYQLLALRMGIENEDLMCVSDEDPELLGDLGCRSRGLEAAADWLVDQSVSARSSVLSGSRATRDETVHTAIVPLDLEIGAGC